VVNSVHDGQEAPETLSVEIEAALRSLADKLHALMREPGQHTTSAPGRHGAGAPGPHGADAPGQHGTGASGRHGTGLPGQHGTGAPGQHGTGPPSAGAAGGDTVLLDVEIGEVRLLALRQGQPSPMSLLSPREQEIARMVAQGYPNKTIASVLEISSWTVASHLRRIFVKLQISSRAAMATCLLGTEFNGLPTLLDNVIDENITSQPRSSPGTGLRPVPMGGPSFANGHNRQQVSIAKGAR
jgi:DNA-binding CsgD family transcriptional regulator